MPVRRSASARVVAASIATVSRRRSSTTKSLPSPCILRNGMCGMPHIPFRKMHGLGNDFVVLDRRLDTVALDAATTRALADRRTGIGCDQLILIEPAQDPAAQIFMRILNADGTEAEACGNGTRCLARLVADETGENRIR